MLRRINFSFWYFFHPPWDSGISPPELLEFLDHHPAGCAIDLGCGTGTNVITMVEHGWKVTGVDFAPRAVALAKRKMRQAGVQADVFVGDVTNLKGVTGPFDFALDLGCFHGIPDRPAYLAQLARILAPGGHWLMYGMLKPHREEPRPGLTPSDLDLIEPSGFHLVNRKDGWDVRSRPSAWFLFQRLSR